MHLSRKLACKFHVCRGQYQLSLIGKGVLCDERNKGKEQWEEKLSNEIEKKMHSTCCFPKAWGDPKSIDCHFLPWHVHLH
ncbi:unnamed protein product [Urochloa humidicola]